MRLLQQPVERRLSAMLGADVSFEKLHFSLLGGSVEAQGVVVAGHEPTAPLLTIRRVRAEIALGAALKKEFVVRSLTIEAPVLTIVRGADGQLNLPRRFQPSDGQPPPSASVGRSADTPSDTSASDENPGTWKFEAQKVLLVDGEIHYRDASGYHVSIEQLLAELKEAGGGMELTLIADSAGRRDQPADLGQIRANARAENVPNLAQWRRASIQGNLEVVDRLRVRAHLPAVDPPDVKLEFNGSFNVADVMKFLPEAVGASVAARAGTMRGRAELSGRATYRHPEGLRVPELIVRAVDVILSRGAAADARP